jgi:uncharacterized protein (TIGR04255 family)
MPERFRNPPLVELAAELRWGTGGSVAPTPGQPMLLPTFGQHEEFFMRFGTGVGAFGYDRIERLIPAGFLTPPFQATYRFRKKQPEQGTTLYQVGGGVFTANITPPYHSWKQFRPVVQQGVECLIKTRSDQEKDIPFGPAILRYIDAFGPKFTEGRSAIAFVRDVLGFNVDLPGAVKAEIAPNAAIKAVLQFSFQLHSGQQMSLVLGEGMVAGEQAIVMDISLITEAAIQATVHDVMDTFDASHEVIHRAFVGMSEKLFHIMEPVAETDQ